MNVRTMRPLRASATLLSRTQQYQQPIRHFLPNPLASGSPQLLEASRTLPYSSTDLYNMISDIERYPEFVPYCRELKVTQWSEPDAHHKRAWPQEAVMKVGFSNEAEDSFVSHLYCAPPVPDKGRAGVGIVEAISGDVKGTSIDKDHIQHHTHRDEDMAAAEKRGQGKFSPLTMLRTQWRISAFPFKPSPDGSAGASAETREMSDVSLKIEYKFSNQLYEFMSKAVAPKVADKMIDAFEKRAKSLYGKK